MLEPGCKISISREWNVGNSEWVVEHVNNIEITMDSDTLADTCKIILPKNTEWVGYKEIPIRRGDKVVVFLGYNGKLTKRFEGFVSVVSAKTPTTITVEDWMFKLRQVNVKRKVYKNCKLSALLKDILPGDVKYILSGDISIGEYRTTATTVAGELKELKSNYGIRSFFELVDDKPVLYVYTVFPEQRSNAGLFDHEMIIENNLEYRRKDDVLVRIKGTSILTNNKRITYEEGDSGGETREVNAYGLTLAELKVFVKNWIKKLKFDGLRGDFTTYGQPVVRKMEVIDLEVEGVTPATYQVKEVIVAFGQDGYKQKITLENWIKNL